MDRRRYADAYGPTTGDRVRLGDSDLYLEIEKDFTHYGDECVFGGGKVIREGMGQAAGVGEDDALDLVITNAVIVDYTGIYKVGRTVSFDATAHTKLNVIFLIGDRRTLVSKTTVLLVLGRLVTLLAWKE